MSFIFATDRRKETTFAESWDDAAGKASDAVIGDRLWDASREIGMWRDGSNAEWLATVEAYERRAKEIHDATGVQIANPARQPLQRIENGRVISRTTAELEGEWRQALEDVATAHPDQVDVIRPGRPIREDALAVTRGAETEFNAAMAEADRLSMGSRFANVLGGGIAGMARDPLQVSTLLLGAGPSAARSVGGRILQTMLTEAAINGGVEAAVQASSQGWRREAGVENGLGPALQQVGLAAAFGGGFGGLVAGGGEVFRALGRAAPTDAMERIAAGAPEAGDFQAVAEALQRPMHSSETRVARLVEEQAALDREAFGALPEGLAGEEAAPLAADAIRAIEEPADTLPPVRDPEESFRQIQRIVGEDQPLGRKPRQPQSLFDFLASIGGIKDEGGALSALGLSRKFVPGRGPLVRKTGKSLDYAREAAAEAGYLDHVAGHADEAVAVSTPDQLLKLIEREAAGDKVFSRQMDGALIDEAAEFAGRVAAPDAYRRILQEVDTAIEQLQLPKVNDSILRRAAAIAADDGDDPAIALERALDEDYRLAADEIASREEALSDDFDIPFFDEGPNTGPAARAGGEVADGSGPPSAGDGAASAGAGGRLPDGGAAEGPPAGPLRPAGDTFEPGTPQAAEQAAMVLKEAKTASPLEFVDLDAGWKAGADLKKLPDSEGRLSRPAAIRYRDEIFRAESHELAMRQVIARYGEDAALDIDAAPEKYLGYLVERPAEKVDAAETVDLWDAMPAGKDADGQTVHATHADLIEEADRDGIFADIIKNCEF